MTKVAFTLIGGKDWTGGYNYLLNLFKALAKYESRRITPVLFVGNDINELDLAPFSTLEGVEIVRSALMDEKSGSLLLIHSILLGRHVSTVKLFQNNGIQVVFEAARFFGWRLNIPTIAWIPDFQHKYLRHLFSNRSYWKRDLGFRAQIICGRNIMLSSEDAKNDCEKFYPSSIKKTHVVRFAVPARSGITAEKAREVADSYGLPKYFFILPNQFWKHKNHTLIIDTLDYLKKRGETIVVAVSGKQSDPRDPEYFPQIMARVKQLGLENEFRILGLIPYDHLLALMSLSVALINPSKFEGWSTTVEEAKAQGVSLILSDLKVHIEQAGEQAAYFCSDSPIELANLLAMRINSPTENIRPPTKETQSDAVKTFARSFTDYAVAIAQGIK